MKTFYLGSAIRFRVSSITDQDGAITDPQSIWGVLYDATSTIVGTGNMTKTATGDYYLTIQSSTNHAIGVAEFEVNMFNGTNTFKDRDTQIKFKI